MPRELTEEQKKRQAERLAAMQTPIEQADAEAQRPVKAVSFSLMVAAGQSVKIGEMAFQIAPFVLSKVPAAGQFLALCPHLLTTHVLAARKNSGTFDVEKTAALLAETKKKLGRDEEEPMTPEQVQYFLSSTGLSLTETEVAAMLDLLVLAVSRKHPDVERTFLDENMNIPIYLQMLYVILEENPYLADPI